KRGIHSSQRGRYQFQSPPSSFIAAGSSTPRISVASINTATASPTPSCLIIFGTPALPSSSHRARTERSFPLRDVGSMPPSVRRALLLTAAVRARTLVTAAARACLADHGSTLHPIADCVAVNGDRWP